MFRYYCKAQSDGKITHLCYCKVSSNCISLEKSYYYGNNQNDWMFDISTMKEIDLTEFRDLISVLDGEKVLLPIAV